MDEDKNREQLQDSVRAEMKEDIKTLREKERHIKIYEDELKRRKRK